MNYIKYPNIYKFQGNHGGPNPCWLSKEDPRTRNMTYSAAIYEWLKMVKEYRQGIMPQPMNPCLHLSNPYPSLQWNEEHNIFAMVYPDQRVEILFEGDDKWREGNTTCIVIDDFDIIDYFKEE